MLKATNRLLTILVVFVLLATACGDGDFADSVTEAASDSGEAMDDSGGDNGAVETADFDGADDAMDEDAMADDAMEAPEEPAVATQPVPRNLTAADIGRKIIFTASVNVEVEDVAAAGQEASDIIEDLGGFVFGQNTQGGVNAQSTITFKVLPDDFGTALERLGGIGELRSQQISTDDVTERVVDLESRIGVAELGVARLRTAMEDAATLKDFADLEALLLSRESDLEVMKGQLRTLQDRIDLATITLTLSQNTISNELAIASTLYAGHDAGVGCPGQREDIRIEQDTPATLCLEVLNRGEQTLTDVEITDTVLDIDNSDLIEVFGTLDELAPGQSAMVAVELDVERTVQLRLRAVATPVTEDGVAIAGQAVRHSTSPRIPTFESEKDPGFSNGFDAAVDLLKAIWVVVIVSIGFLLPLLILLPILWLVWRFLRPLFTKRKEARAAKIEAQLANNRYPAAQPPPPAAKAPDNETDDDSGSEA